MEHRDGPFAGIKIVEMTTALTGPLAVGMMVDQGASAIKVEPLGLGDPVRAVGITTAGISAMFQVANRGKESIAIDVTDPRGLSVVRELIAEADVFVQNMRPGVIDRLGLGADVVRAEHPELIMVSISGFGPDGPYADRRVYDAVIQAQSGLAMSQTGRGSSEPAFLRQTAADKITAYTVAQAIGAALFARERDPHRHGQEIELSMLDSVVSFLFVDAADQVVLADNDMPHAPNSSVATLKPMALQDGYVVLTPVTDREFHAMASAFGVDSSDPEIATASQRWRNPAATRAVYDAVKAAAATTTLAAAVDALDTHDVPYGVATAIDAVPDDAQVVHNQIFFDTDTDDRGRIRQARPAAKFSRTPSAIANPLAPHLGADTEAILKRLGYGNEVDQLIADGVVADRSPAESQ